MSRNQYIRHNSMIFFMVLMLGLISLPAMAEGSKELCRLLPAHKPSDDVAYQPGVDVYGNAVVPADINSSSSFQLPEAIKIPLSVNLAEEFGLNEFTSEDLNAPLGILEVTKDGRVMKDGRDLTNQAYALCDEDQKPQQILPEEESEEADGQAE